MNSIVIVNWEDKDFAERVRYSLEKQGFTRTEDYEDVGVRCQVWSKESKDNARGRVIENDPLAPIKLIPAELMVDKILPRLQHSLEEKDGWSDIWIRHMAVNIVYDLQGKPG